MGLAAEYADETGGAALGLNELLFDEAEFCLESCDTAVEGDGVVHVGGFFVLCDGLGCWLVVVVGGKSD